MLKIVSGFVLGLSIAVIILMGFLAAVNHFSFFINRDIANNLSAKQIREVKPGMTLEEVLTLLGKPYKYRALHGTHLLTCESPKERYEIAVNANTNIQAEIETIFADTSYCCEANRKELEHKRLTLEYTRPSGEFCYPMLWIHFDGQYRVEGVYAKKYDWIDDQCIYSLYGAEKDSADIYPAYFFINEWEFERCFP